MKYDAEVTYDTDAGYCIEIRINLSNRPNLMMSSF